MNKISPECKAGILARQNNDHWLLKSIGKDSERTTNVEKINQTKTIEFEPWRIAEVDDR